MPCYTLGVPEGESRNENDLLVAQEVARAALRGRAGSRGTRGEGVGRDAEVRRLAGAASVPPGRRELAAERARAPRSGDAAADSARILAAVSQRFTGNGGGAAAGACLAGGADEYARLGLRGSMSPFEALRIERLHLSREARPVLSSEAHQRDIEKDLGDRPGESLSDGCALRRSRSFRSSAAIAACAGASPSAPMPSISTEHRVRTMAAPSRARRTRRHRRRYATPRYSGSPGARRWGERT